MNRLLTMMAILLMSICIEAHAATIQLPATGQTSCWDGNGIAISCIGTGQDGEFISGSTGAMPRFVDNGDQTITDKLSGLVWTKDANLMVTRDPSYDTDYNESDLSQIQNDGAVSWQHALDYIKKLNNENYLGKNDWRLPNRNELASLINRQQQNSAPQLMGQGFLNVKGFVTYAQNGGTVTASKSYWSSSTASTDSLSWFAVTIGIASGAEGIDDKSSYDYVWPVRSGPSGLSGSLTIAQTGQNTCYTTNGLSIACSGTGQDGELQAGATWPATRFSDNSNQTITDNLTGLIWSKNANPANSLETWPAALDYIKTLNSQNFLGFNDWRLPNTNELESLITVGQPTIAPWLTAQGFTNVSSPYWSSSSCEILSILGWNRAWNVSYGFGGGTVSCDDKTQSSNYVWPVRSGKWGIAVSPASLDFGSIPSGTNSSPKTITITNNSLVPIDVSSLTLVGTDIALFSLDAGNGSNGTCGTSHTLTPSGSCTVTVKFSPTSLGGKGASLRITSSDPVTPQKDCVLSGFTPTQTLRTGQISCWDNYGKSTACSGTGQDGETKSGIAWPYPRFIDNDDQTITDKLTGLVWVKNANLMVTRDPSFDTDFDSLPEKVNDGLVTWQHAFDYIKKLNNENYLGHNDWHLPNSIELKSLLNRQKSANYSWLTSQGFTNVLNNIYWSSAFAGSGFDFSGNPVLNAFVVDMGYGLVAENEVRSKSFVWPVRMPPEQLASAVLPKTGQTLCAAVGAWIDCAGTGQDGELQAGVAWPAFRYSDNGDQTVTDVLTDLIWTKDANVMVSRDPSFDTDYNPADSNQKINDGAVSYPHALGYIKKLNNENYLGYNDWRLPNVNEIDSNASAELRNFVNVTGGLLNSRMPHWSSTVFPYDPKYVLITMGDDFPAPKNSAFVRVWPVRGGRTGVADPFVASISLGNSALTSSAKITATVDCQTAALMTFSFDNIKWSAWETYSASKSLTLPIGDGLKTVYVRFKDGNGYESNVYSATITLDTKAPVGTIHINSGDALTNYRLVHLTLTATDTTSGIADMQFSEDNKIWSEWETFNTSKDFTLTTINDGIKKVHVRFRDTVGKISKAFSDSIKLDTLAPAKPSVKINAGKVTTQVSDVVLTLSATSAVSMRISLDGGSSWGDWEVFARTKAVHLLGTGEQTVKAVYKDLAGNFTDIVSASITLIPAVSPAAFTSSMLAGHSATIKFTSTTMTMVFNANGSVTVNGIAGTWSINQDGTLTTTFPTDGLTYSIQSAVANSLTVSYFHAATPEQIEGPRVMTIK